LQRNINSFYHSKINGTAMINLLNLSKVYGENYAVKSIDLTILVQGLFDLSERVFVPQGLRLQEGTS